MLLDAEATAFRTGAERVVEREQPRLNLGIGESRNRAGELFREDEALGAGELRVYFGNAFLVVMAGHSRLKDGVLPHAYVPAVHVFLSFRRKTWITGTRAFGAAR